MPQRQIVVLVLLGGLALKKCPNAHEGKCTSMLEFTSREDLRTILLVTNLLYLKL